MGGTGRWRGQVGGGHRQVEGTGRWRTQAGGGDTARWRTWVGGGQVRLRLRKLFYWSQLKLESLALLVWVWWRRV